VHDTAPETRALRIVDLSELDVGDESRFGGKACGLARLRAEGARVPECFAVEATTSDPEAWTEADRAAFRERAARLAAAGPLAVRSSAIGEDAPDRSFAGMFETVLGVAVCRVGRERSRPRLRGLRRTSGGWARRTAARRRARRRRLLRA
jgi:hypothetical protein